MLRRTTALLRRCCRRQTATAGSRPGTTRACACGMRGAAGVALCGCAKKTMDSHARVARVPLMVKRGTSGTRLPL